MFYHHLYWLCETYSWYWSHAYHRRPNRALYGADFTNWIYSDQILKLTEGNDDDET